MERKVLVVDDNLDFLALMEALLTHEGYTCVQCPRASEARGLASELQPMAIIADLVMPGTSGTQAIAELKANPDTSHIPIVVCTAAVFELTNHPELTGRYGCAAVLKPFELDYMLEMLASITAGCEAELVCPAGGKRAER